MSVPTLDMWGSLRVVVVVCVDFVGKKTFIFLQK